MMRKLPSGNNEQKIIELLTADKKLFELTRYCLALGAGHVFREDKTPERDAYHVREIAFSLSDALAEPLPTEWETEIGQLVLAGDVKKLETMAKQIFADTQDCPLCRWSSRIKISKTRKLCLHCRYVFPF
ncbi:MAG: hypothetical protein ABFD76_11570 [Smithella sp.]